VNPTLKPLADQVVVITGATSGIGLTTARLAVAHGAKVVLIARSEDALRQAVADLERRGGEVAYAVADVADRAQLERAAEVAVERFGRFDTWVNGAGVGAYAKLEEISDEDHRRIFETNYWGTVYGSLIAVRHFRRRGGGALINIGSIASEMPSPILSSYTATKHAVKGFTDSLRLELRHDGAPVSVTLVKPSGISTPFGDHAKNYMDAASRVPPPVYDPALVARAILHAAERPTRSITVGGAGRLMVAFARLAPRLADAVFATAFFKTARDPSRPKRPGDSLHEAGSDGRRTRGDESLVLKRSLYTSAALRPLPWLAAAVALGALAALASGKRGHALRALAGGRGT
jgi:short-subunit dehydrogenase